MKLGNCWGHQTSCMLSRGMGGGGGGGLAETMILYRWLWYGAVNSNDDELEERREGEG